MDLTHSFDSKMIEENFCLANSTTTHTILKDKKYFQNLTLIKAMVNTIFGHQTELKALKEQISCCLRAQNFVLIYFVLF